MANNVSDDIIFSFEKVNAQKAELCEITEKLSIS